MTSKETQSLRVADYMTKAPALVDEDLSIADAQERMYVNNIRHLVVMRGNLVLAGVVSSRDLNLAASVSPRDPKDITVSAAMATKPYTCGPEASLEEVATEMERHRYGCTVVMEGNKPIGIFTTTDALRALRHFVAGTPVEPDKHARHITPAPSERERVEHNTHAGDSVSKPGVSPSPNQGTIR